MAVFIKHDTYIMILTNFPNFLSLINVPHISNPGIFVQIHGTNMSFL
jgi:hypothetical protein